ncbi:MAG: hypothetical protein K8T10_19410 [Candidatus Eremiobacteraeota bacterium]|nr:hypothetical protein [Candidatus Eremiobacteraeota bacterium]
MNKIKFFAKSLISAIILALMFFSISQASNITPEPDFVAKSKILIGESITLPDKLNGKSIQELKGYDIIADDIEKIGNLNNEIIAYLLIYPNIKDKWKKSAEYAEKSTKETTINEVFGDKFKPLNPDSLMENSPYKLSEANKEQVKKYIENHINLLNSKNFEDFIYEDKVVEPKTSAVFYSNAVKKTENQLKKAYEKNEKLAGTIGEKVKDFIRKNIIIDFKIGDRESYSSIKKNFQPGDPLYIGFEYSSENIDGEIPIEWRIVAPNKREKIGRASLIGGKSGEYKQLAKGRIPEKAPPGTYEVIVTLYPGKGDYTHKEDYAIGGIPVKITNVFILGKGKKIRESYRPGDPILFVMRYKPFVGGDEKALFVWNIFDPKGNKVEKLSKSLSLKLKSYDKDIQTKYIKAKIPGGIMPGVYKFQAQIRKGEGIVSSEILTFKILPGLKPKK